MSSNYALLGLLLFISIVKASVYVDDEIDAVIIQADKDGEADISPREGRQFGFPFQFLGGVSAPQSRACVNSAGAAGNCQSYTQCYPFYHIPSSVPTWALGSKDACSYSDKETTYTGTCCQTSQVQPLRQAWGLVPWGRNVWGWQLGSYYPQSIGQGQLSRQRPQNQRQWGIPGGSYPGGIYPAGTFPGGVGGGFPGAQGGLYPGYPPQQSIPGIPQQGAPGGFPQRPGIQQPPQRPPHPQPSPPRPQPLPTQPQPVPTHPPIPTHPPATRPPATRPPATRPPATRPPATQPSQASVSVDSGSYSQCGIKGTPLVYDQNGEDAEAVQRTKPQEFRIKGGWPADKHEWPWIASIWNNGRQFCGGSLVSPTHILTAAHCIDHMSARDVRNLEVKLGDHNINSVSEARTTNKKVTNIIKHKGFSQRTLHNDVAILKLSSPVSYSKTVRLVCMAPSGANVGKDTIATVVGWGMLSHVGPRPSELQEITFKTWSNQRCSSTYGSNAPGGIMDHMLCAGQKGQDSCMGDSGGPMVRAVGNHYEQIGIVSWGIACGKEHFPGVYTRVGKMRAWIDRVLNKY